MQTAQDKLVIISPHWEGIEQDSIVGSNLGIKQTGRTIKMNWLIESTSSDIRFIEAVIKRLKRWINRFVIWWWYDAFAEISEMGF